MGEEVSGDAVLFSRPRTPHARRNGDGNFAGTKLAVEPTSRQINWDVFLDKVRALRFSLRLRTIRALSHSPFTLTRTSHTQVTERVKLASGSIYRIYTIEGARIK